MRSVGEAFNPQLELNRLMMVMMVCLLSQLPHRQRDHGPALPRVRRAVAQPVRPAAAPAHRQPHGGRAQATRALPPGQGPAGAAVQGRLRRGSRQAAFRTPSRLAPLWCRDALRCHAGVVTQFTSKALVSPASSDSSICRYFLFRCARLCVVTTTV